MLKSATAVLSRLFCRDKTSGGWSFPDFRPGFARKRVAQRLKDDGGRCFMAGDFDRALALYRESLEIDPVQVSVHSNLGVVLYSMGRLDDALVQYAHALELNPDFVDALSNQGLALTDLGRLDEALACFDRAIELAPNVASHYFNRGNVLVKLKRNDEALVSYDLAVCAQQDYALAHNNRAALLVSMKRFEEGLQGFCRAIELTPDSAIAYNNRGHALDSLRRYDEAVASYNTAIKLKPDYATAYHNRAVALDSLNRLDEALASYYQTLLLQPDYEFLYGQWLDAKMQICDWSDYAENIVELAARIERGEKASAPFFVLSKLDSRELQQKAAQIYVKYKCPADDFLPVLSRNRRHEKIRIGYFSADFRNHPVSFLLAELLEIHDRSRFEITGFSFGADVRDEMSTRIAAACDRFIDVRQKSDEEVALLARSLEIDIAVDLGGFTTESRTRIFALRAAPLQLSYLGYLGTMGAEYIDYLIADPTIVPDSNYPDYDEKIISLPCYQVNDSLRPISDRIFTRAELGLPEQGIVFCCFNNSFKITPVIFDTWMRILKLVEGSVIWLLGESPPVVANLRREAERRGVDAGRLVFAQRVPLPEYLARYRVADLFLDTSPYNAGTTASDALWAGLPVLTCIGQSFAARMAASLLKAIDLPEMIASGWQEYETLAVDLARHPKRLHALRDKLAENRLNTALFDTRGFRSNIESAYTQIYERYQSGLPPEHLRVS